MYPDRFKPAIEKILALQNHDRYLGAFIFGSVARGEAADSSDLDIKVIVDKDNPCKEINHPHIAGVKLDLTFLSQDQLNQESAADKNRPAMIAESIILFDKNGDLQRLKDAVLEKPAPKFTKKDYQGQQFMAYHANDKVQRNLKSDPDTALFAMHAGINDLLKIHYGIQGKWWVSSKRILKDLDSWDRPLAELVRLFVREQNTDKKFRIWSDIVDHILKPIGGRQKIEENNCDCEICKQDLANLAG